MWAETVPLGVLVLGSTYVGCGAIQVTAGILFFLLPTVLRTGSNAWTGLVTVLSGFLLLKVSGKKTKAKVNLGIHVGVLLTNLCNLLLTELSEWRALLAADEFREFIRQGHVTFLLAAYFSTTVPTVIAFVVSFLATQYRCCILVTSETSPMQLSKKGNVKTTSGRSSISYDWVFQDKGEEDVEILQDLMVLGHSPQDLSISEKRVGELLMAREAHSSIRKSPASQQIISAVSPEFCLSSFSNQFRNVPASFRPFNWSSRTSSSSETSVASVNAALSTTFTIDDNDDDDLNRLILPTIQAQNKVGGGLSSSSSSSSQKFSERDLMSESPDYSVHTDWLSSTSSPVTVKPVGISSEDQSQPIREVQSKLHVSSQVAYSSDLPRVEWCLPSRPLSSLVKMDTDSLVYLKHLELLARQWRVDHEHQKLHKDVAKRMSLIDSNDAELGSSNA